MRKSRVNLPNRCYHLISRVAHRAFFLDDGERTRLVDLIRRVSRFSGVKLLAYGVMSNHFHGTDPRSGSSEFAASEIRAHKGRVRADQEGGAAMRANVYCGNLL